MYPILRRLLFGWAGRWLERHNVDAIYVWLALPVVGLVVVVLLDVLT